MTQTNQTPKAWSRRPSFVPSQSLTAEQLNAGFDDELRRLRLLNRAVHGHGVVLGLGVTAGADGLINLDHGCLELTGGLALDRHGRMLRWDGGRLAIRDVVRPHPLHEGVYTLYAHYARRPPAAGSCHCSGGDGWTWQEDGVVFSLRPGCRPADRSCPRHPDGCCVGHDEYLCRRTGGLPGEHPGTVPESPDLQWLLRGPGPLQPIDCDDWTYDPDLDVAVPLACLRICDVANRKEDEHEHPDDSGPAVVDCEPHHGFCPSTRPSCHVRPLVYRNPLLYELANDCDVTFSRVRAISWQSWIDQGWSTPVPWARFRDRITEDAPGFEIRFSRPIQAATLHHGSILMVALYQEESADYWTAQQVPLRKLVLLDHDPAAGLASGVRLAPARDWLNAEVTGKRSNLYDGARFEVTVRGQLLRDACGQMLDARPIGIHSRTRQHRPGGDFVSAFRVDANPDRRARDHDDND
jgi:hypothetical protein